MAYQATMIFSQGKQGWSESWYLSDPASLTDAMEAALSLVSARRRLCGVGCNIEAVRVSDETIIGDSRLRTIPAIAVAVDTADQAGAAVLVRVEAGGLYRRSLWLRGCPDNWIDSAGLLAPNVSAIALNPINAFLLSLIGPSIRAGLKVGLKTGTGGTGVAVGGGDLAADADGWTVVTVAGMPSAVGEKILMKKWKGPDQKVLNRSYEVVAVGAGSLTISLEFADLTFPATNYRGRIYSRVADYAFVTRGEIVRAAIRKTGRAFFVPAGRRYSARG